MAGLLLTVLSSGCTRNDGDIGDLFGWWTLDTLTADGAEQDLLSDEVLLYTFSFQTDIVQIQQTFPHADFMRWKGMWSRDEETLYLDFGHTDDAGGYYEPPVELHLIRGTTPLSILTLNGKRMHLRYKNSESGVTYDYYFSKVI